MLIILWVELWAKHVFDIKEARGSGVSEIFINCLWYFMISQFFATSQTKADFQFCLHSASMLNRWIFTTCVCLIHTHTFKFHVIYWVNISLNTDIPSHHTCKACSSTLSYPLGHRQIFNIPSWLQKPGSSHRTNSAHVGTEIGTKMSTNDLHEVSCFIMLL